MSNADILTPEQSGSKSRLRLWLRLLKITRSIENEIRENLRTEFASTLPRFDVMSALSRTEIGLKMSQISGELMVSNGNVTGIVDRLVKEEMVSREPLEGDRRAYRVCLTQKGCAEFNHQAIAHESWINSLLDSFDPDKADEMNECLADAYEIQRGKT